MKRHLFIYGNQPFENNKSVENHIQKIKKSFPDSELTVLDCANLVSNNTDASAFTHELWHNSLFDAHKIIHLKNFQKLSGIKASQETGNMVETIQNAVRAENFTLIISAGIKKITEIPKAFQNLLTEFATIKTMVTYDNFDPSQKIIEYASNHSVQLLPQAISVLVTVCGTDLSLLDGELAKLSLLFPKDHKITAHEILQSVGNHRQYTLFNLTDSVISKNLKGYTVYSENYFEDKSNNPVSLFSVIAQQYQKLNVIVAMRSQKIPENLIISALKSHPRLVEKMIHQTRYYSQSELENIVISLSRKDLRIKHASTKDGFHILSNIFLNIIQNRYKTSHSSPKDFCRHLIY